MIEALSTFLLARRKIPVGSRDPGAHTPPRTPPPIAMSALTASVFTPTLARRAAAPRAGPKRHTRAMRCNAMYDSVQSRREAESNRVLERSRDIHSMEEFEAALSLAGEKLVMVAIESEEECVMQEDMWSKEATGASAYSFSADNNEACRALSASLARISREATDVEFLNVQVLETGGGARQVANALNVHKFPTYQYYKVRDDPAPASERRDASDPEPALIVTTRVAPPNITTSRYYMVFFLPPRTRSLPI